MKTIVIGGVAGGASTATRLRRNDENAEIIILEKSEYVSFANCGMPYYIGDVIKEKSDLIVQTPKKFKNRFNIDVRTFSEVLSIDTKNNKVLVKDLVKNTKYEESYDNLVLSPGAKPIKPNNIEGLDNENVFFLKTLKDMENIKEYILDNKPKTCAVIGAGFIGIEMVENISGLGIKTTLIEASNNVLGNVLDLDMAHEIHNHIRDNDIRVITNEFAVKIENGYVNLASGKKIESDIVIVSIGVLPDTNFLKESNISLGSKGEILVDEFLRTNISNIYAVGDAISVTNYIDGSKVLIPLAGPANKQGRIVADNICKNEIEYKGTQGTAIVKVFDMTVATTGLNESYLKRNNIKYFKSITYSYSNATYYPNATPMRIKLIYDEKGKIFGSQITGYEGVDKRIDVISTAIRANMSVFDLTELELAYAPPYSSAKDPVNMAGFVAENHLKNKTTLFYIEDIENIKEDAIILDVRTDEEFLRSKIDNSIKISVDELRNKSNLLDKSKDIYLYCRIGQRGYIAERILKQQGFTSVFNLSGGYLLYEEMIQDIDI